VTPEEIVMQENGRNVTRRGEQGFTLIEALIAMVILIVGIAAISNLMVVAGSSNAVANHTTAASAIAAQQMDLLKSRTFAQLGAGGTVAVPPVHAAGHPPCGLASTAPGNFNCDAVVTGVGTVHVQWLITPALAGAAPATTVFIELVAEPVAPSVGRRSRASFTTFRTANPD
jgi:type II secretory pathway pseudopilin PulG